MSQTSFLDPFVLARIGNLQLRAQTVVEGVVAGLHESPYKGYSLEFAQHREYASGDELKYLDWKVYGRTDRFFVKQFEQESDLKVYILLDASGSMGFRGRESAMSKYEYGATLAASLAYLAVAQGDSAGLGLFGAALADLIPPHPSFAHLSALLDRLARASPAGPTAVAAALESLAHVSRKRSLVILISDLLDEPAAMLKGLKHLRFIKHELIVFHLLDPDEINFPYSGNLRFEALEGDEEVALEAEMYRDEYRAAIRGFVDHLRLTLRSAGVRYYFHGTCEPMDRVIQAALNRNIR